VFDKEALTQGLLDAAAGSDTFCQVVKKLLVAFDAIEIRELARRGPDCRQRAL